MTVKPVKNCILIKRNNYDPKSGNCRGEIIEPCNSGLDEGKIVHYKLLDKKFYTIVSNMDNYDFVKFDCIFGVEE